VDVSGRGVRKGDWRSPQKSFAHSAESNIFNLSKKHWRTTLLSDITNGKNYPSEWFEEAFECMPQHIIKSWKRSGEAGKMKEKIDPTYQRCKRYTDSEFSEFLKRE
jgi:hypothetical protein